MINFPIARRSRRFSFVCLSLTILCWNTEVGSRISSAPISTLRIDSTQAQAQAQLPATSPLDEVTASRVEVLVIHSYNLDFDWTRRQKRGIDQSFKESEHEVTVHHEFLDAKRYPELGYREDFLSYVQQKYKDTPLQALMISDDPGLNLILTTRDQYFPDLPVVFMGINKVRPEILDIPWLTGAFEARAPIPTVVEAKRQTGADHVIVISDSSETGQANLRLLDDLSSYPEAPKNVVLVEDLAPKDIEAKVGVLPDSWPIFMAGQLRQDTSDSALMNLEKDVSVLRSQVPNPIYTDTAPRLGHGAVGGQVLDGEYHAQQAVQLVEKLLDGVSIEEIEPIIKSENRWIFDARELARIRVRKDQVIEGSLLINEEPSFYEQYKNLVWITLTGFSFGLVTIVVLSHAIHRQKQAERQLKEHERQLEQLVSDRTAELSKTLNELRHTQMQLIQTEKLSSLGQLVGGIAHEFNNPLSFVHSNLSCLRGYIEDLLALIRLYQSPADQHLAIQTQIEEIDLDYIQQDAPALIESTRKGTTRIQKIVQTLQKFSRADQQGIKPTDLNQSLESTLLMLNAQIGEDIEVVKDYGDLPLVNCQPGDINQVLMNVLLNSIAALEESSDRQADGLSKQIMVRTEATNNRVKITIRDNGPGIPLEIQDKVFDPFFTTKPVGKGTGLGLALSYQTVQQHHGNIQLHSLPNKGTTLLVELPVKQPSS